MRKMKKIEEKSEEKKYKIKKNKQRKVIRSLVQRRLYLEVVMNNKWKNNDFVIWIFLLFIVIYFPFSDIYLFFYIKMTKIYLIKIIRINFYLIKPINNEIH